MRLPILKNEIIKSISYALKLEKNLGKPTIQQIESTNACMMTCIMCPRKHMKRNIGFMDFELFKKIIDQARWNEEIWLHHFGDPLLHPKIIDMINYAAGKGIKPKISVNPNLLNKAMSNKLLNSKLHTLMISLDGIDNETYSYFRGKNAKYDMAEKNIMDLLNHKKNNGSKMKIIISMILMKNNYNQKEEFKKKWKALGADEVSIKKFITWDGSYEEINALGSENFKKIKNRSYCSEPWIKITVTWDGKVVPCCYDYDNLYILGDLKRESLEDIWNGQKIKILRKSIKENNLKKIPLCKNCNDQMNTSLFRYNPLKIRFRHIVSVLNKLKSLL